MSASGSPAAARRSVPWGPIVAVLWVLTFVGARLALDRDLALEPRWLRVIVALTPVLPTAVFLVTVARSMRGMDELHRRVQLEALAFAFPAAVLLLMTLGLMQLAIDLPAEDWSYRHIWPFLAIFYFGGVVLAWRRYR